ncbi:MAG: hypothetical protein ABL952_17575 [Pyrinomonadaceae bacterium]
MMNCALQKARNIATVILLFAVSVLSQSVEDGWKGIVLLKTTKPVVDAKFGTPKIDDNGYNMYKTDEAFVQINYSSAPCEIERKHPGIKRGELNIPEGTVLDMWVNLVNPIPIAKLNLDLSKYDRDTGGDVLMHVAYHGKKGLSLSALIRNGTEYVQKLTYRSLDADLEKYHCPRKQPK